MDRHISIDNVARFLWHDHDGAMRMATGKARDISRHGVFIVADSTPSPGTEVQVIVDMPLPKGGGQTARLIGKGIALQVEEGHEAGFAAEVLLQPSWASLPPAMDGELFDALLANA